MHYNNPSLIYENQYMGFYVKVYSDHVEFKNARGSQVAHLHHISGIRIGPPLIMGITLTIHGQSQMIPTSKKKEVERAILDAQQQWLASNPYTQPPVQQPTGTPIEMEIQRVKMEIEQIRLQLGQVNANMSNIRSHYQQGHIHRAGFLHTMERSHKDSRLRKQQPVKERLQREKLALEQKLNQLKMLKAQGVTHITQ